MKYKLKKDKQSYYAVCDWADQYDYEMKDITAKCVSTMRFKGDLTPYKKPLLSGKKNGFKRINWNQWDSEKGCIKDMYIEFTDLKLELIFLCSAANCIDNKEENALY
jgi:hypothetical protein